MYILILSGSPRKGGKILCGGGSMPPLRRNMTLFTSQTASPCLKFSREF